MSSSARLSFKPTVRRKDWLAFCKEHGIKYSPLTSGRNTFYLPILGGIEIHFGRPTDDSYPPLTEEEKQIGVEIVDYPWVYHKVDVHAHAPPINALEIVCQCVFMGGINNALEIVCQCVFMGGINSDKNAATMLLDAVIHIVEKIKKRFKPIRVDYDKELL